MSLTFDFRVFERMARDMDAFEKQVPFALANAMTTAAFKVREALFTDTWQQYVEVRNRHALRQALRVEGARKNTLAVAIVGSGPSAERLNLVAHARGGKRDHKGHRIAIAPAGTVRRGARGVPKGQQPRAIIARTPKRALRVTDRGIFVGEGGRLRLRYTFVPDANITADVPFESDFERMMRAEVPRHFADSMRNAMKTAFR